VLEETYSVKRASFASVAIILIALALSLIAFNQAMIAYMIEKDVNQGTYLLTMGLIGLSLSAYMLFQTRSRAPRFMFEPQRVSTTTSCKKCGFKNVRDFQRGDYIFKDAEACPKCGEGMLITSIYREKKPGEEE